MKTAIILSLLSFLFHIQTNAQNTIEGRCVKMRTFFFYAQSPDFHKQGLCYYLKILYL